MAEDLVAFVRARLDEDERLACACPLTEWVVQGPPPEAGISGPAGEMMLAGRHTDDEHLWSLLARPTMHTGHALNHAARHDPARVLAEVEAKQILLDDHSSIHVVVDGYCAREGGECTHAGEAWCPWHGIENCLTLRALALPYAGHPEYREEWSP
jgi:hypothetical protein